jgi:hypothetical protein
MHFFATVRPEQALEIGARAAVQTAEGLRVRAPTELAARARAPAPSRDVV